MRPSRLPELFRQRLQRTVVARVAIDRGMVDVRLGGGLAAGALHDLYAGDDGDAGAAAAFALLLTLCAGSVRPTAWVREQRAVRRCGTLDAYGLVELGADPDRLLLVMPDDEVGVLRAADDIVRHGGAGAVVVELHGRARDYDLTASRRLALAAARVGMLVLVLRIGGDPVASAAETRWRVAAAPSAWLVADAPGHPAFDLSLLRHRSGIAGFDARLEWNRDDRRFEAISGRAPAAVVGGAGTRSRAA